MPGLRDDQNTSIITATLHGQQMKWVAIRNCGNVHSHRTYPPVMNAPLKPKKGMIAKCFGFHSKPDFDVTRNLHSANARRLLVTAQFDNEQLVLT